MVERPASAKSSSYGPPTRLGSPVGLSCGEYKGQGKAGQALGLRLYTCGPTHLQNLCNALTVSLKVRHSALSTMIWASTTRAQPCKTGQGVAGPRQRYKPVCPFLGLLPCSVAPHCPYALPHWPCLGSARRQGQASKNPGLGADLCQHLADDVSSGVVDHEVCAAAL